MIYISLHISLNISTLPLRKTTKRVVFSLHPFPYPLKDGQDFLSRKTKVIKTNPEPL
jgi:hypothetical protein